MTRNLNPITKRYWTTREVSELLDIPGWEIRLKALKAGVKRVGKDYRFTEKDIRMIGGAGVLSEEI